MDSFESVLSDFFVFCLYISLCLIFSSEIFRVMVVEDISSKWIFWKFLMNEMFSCCCRCLFCMFLRIGMYFLVCIVIFWGNCFFLSCMCIIFWNMIDFKMILRVDLRFWRNRVVVMVWLDLFGFMNIFVVKVCVLSM